MKTQISDRVLEIEESKSIGLAAEVHKLKLEGKKILSLNVGEPEFSTHPAILKATIEALNEGKTKYSLVSGIHDLREKIAKRCAKKWNFKLTSKNILVGSGSKNILYSVFQTILNPRDEVLIPAPFWVTFPESIKLAGGVPKVVPTNENLDLDIEEIKKAITKKTKAIIINSPCNPSGRVYHESSLKELAKVADEYDLIVIADEAYEGMVYDGHEMTHFAALSETAFKRTLTVQSFSKSFCMTGFRVGYVVASEDVISMINKFQGHMLGNIPEFSQVGAIKALDFEQEIISDLQEKMQKRKELTVKLFSQIFDFPEPEGAFYIFPDASAYIGKSVGD
ncbi:MAG: aminotransferase class I/II-fold pyridoxal phosphate-dependent enzyme, partial [Bacteriovoracaceae bacterium]